LYQFVNTSDSKINPKLHLMSSLIIIRSFWSQRCCYSYTEKSTFLTMQLLH